MCAKCEQILMLKDASKGFPVGRPVGVLRWSLSSAAADSLVPLTLNCWPEEEGQGKMNVNIEYQLNGDRELHDVDIIIPLSTSDAPQIASIDGTYKHDSRYVVCMGCLCMCDVYNMTYES